MKYISTIVCFFVCLGCDAQNLTNAHGLKYGHWNQDNIDCYYKIIAFSYYDTISFDGDKRLEIRRYDGSETTYGTIAIAGYSGDSISVRDGTFKDYDSSGAISEIIEYHTGLVGSMIDFLHGDTSSYIHSFLDNINANYYDDYTNNRVFRRGFFKGKNYVFSYYPYDDLIISNAEIVSQIDFTKGSDDTQRITFSAKEAISIRNIDHSANVRLLNEESKVLQFPIEIQKGKYIQLKIINTQHADSIKKEDVIMVETVPDNKTYKILITTQAAHISKLNIQRIRKINLSRKKDKYLVVYSCGPYGDLSIIDDKKVVVQYSFYGYKTYKIPLSTLAKNHYQISTSMCYDDSLGIGGVIDLVLKD